MTSTLDIITDSYRESNINGIGVVPSAAQQTEGLRLLNSVVSSVYGFEVGEALKDWPIGTVGTKDGTVEWSQEVWNRPVANVRLLCMANTAQTVYLPEMPSDGARIAIVDVAGLVAAYPVTVNGNGRNIEDGADFVVDTPGANIMWMYRADLAEWVRLDALPDTAGEFPFPPEFDAAFITMLAMRINPRYGRTLAGETGAWMQRSITQLKARYRQKVIVGADIGVLSQTPKGYSPWNTGSGVRRGWMS